jgi:hypothetical protein
MTLAVDDPTADPEWFTFSAWLDRQADRPPRPGFPDRVAALARHRREPVPPARPSQSSLGPARPSLGLSEPGYDEARVEYSRWFRETYPTSAVARATASRIAKDNAPPTPGPPERFEGEVARLAGMVAQALDDVVELLYRVLPPPPDKNTVVVDRLRPHWRELSARVDAIRRAVAAGNQA